MWQGVTSLHKGEHLMPICHPYFLLDFSQMSIYKFIAKPVIKYSHRGGYVNSTTTIHKFNYHFTYMYLLQHSYGISWASFAPSNEFTTSQTKANQAQWSVVIESVRANQSQFQWQVLHRPKNSLMSSLIVLCHIFSYPPTPILTTFLTFGTRAKMKFPLFFLYFFSLISDCTQQLPRFHSWIVSWNTATIVAAI